MQLLWIHILRTPSEANRFVLQQQDFLAHEADDANIVDDDRCG